MNAFQAHQGLGSFINRLELEVNICRKEQPFEIVIPGTSEPLADGEEVVETPGPSGSENNGNIWKRNTESQSRRTESDNSQNHEADVDSNDKEESARWNSESTLTSSRKSSSSVIPLELAVQPSTSTSQISQPDVSYFCFNYDSLQFMLIFPILYFRFPCKIERRRMRIGYPK